MIPTAPERLTDERVYEFAETHFGAFTTSEDEVKFMAEELRAYRAGQLAPEGCVVVREEDLRMFVEFAVDDQSCETCPAKPECLKLGSTDCRAALLAHFGAIGAAAEKLEEHSCRET